MATDDRGKIVDLFDFFQRWPSLRHAMIEVCSGSEISPHDSATLRWMIEVVDRVGPRDLDGT
ncbi:hypothetical protein P775_01090 [Puniceibacterium antarcticum]|uniref:Uncharacterized protein n=1 Tax=Puniceibacterium antarcticum TaxID=1206336 RepID=A0A2G8RKR4_9RHOB|nr:hypothetical protein [Puniceibacterium antarcticum]PIL22092.1 hypothetical protein P775_01090 [Puniceibacterium antarcticum]